MKIFMLILIFILNMGFVFCLYMKNPSFLIIWLTFLSMNLGLMMNLFLNSWMMYSVILLFTGGMMVLFSYMVTLTMNLKISFLEVPKILWMASLAMILSFFQEEFFFDLKMNFSFLFSEMSVFMLTLLAVYLITILLCVVKLATSLSGPMKSFFKNEM